VAGIGRRAASRTCYCLPVSATRVSRHVMAPRAKVYGALLDAHAVERWMVPTGMTSQIHAFDPREGGAFRISLTYDAPTGTGKTTAHTDTYHGRFLRLMPDEEVREVVEFETADPALQGEMTITISLAEADGGTEVLAVHDRLPPGLPPGDNEAGWRSSLAKLAALVEAASTTMSVRPAEAAEVDHLAQVWFDGWQDAHACILPAELSRLRTLESFRNRLQAALPDVRVAGPIPTPVGFCILKGDELYQLYVSAEARGSGVAAALVADAEARLVERGVELAWLACAIGNERAARFYEKCGWRRAGTVAYQPDAEYPAPLEVWRYEKPLR
jgi:uncharacterized protein YndB with AHSA1/START domain/GNAT superfamily N-acetyltransferase